MSVLVYDCGSVENTVTAILDTESGAMIIRGNGDIDNYADESSPWYSEHSDILQVTVDKGITRIGSGTFYGCENLSFVEIANTVTSMGADVFQNCNSLTSIKIPKSIIEIGNGTFTDSGLTEVKFYGNSPTVGTDIFDGVTADVYTPEGNEEWTETVKGTVAGNGSNLTWKEFDSKPNLIEYDELDYFWSKIKKWVNDNKSDNSLPIIDDKTFIKYLTTVISDSNHTNTSTTLYVSNPEYFAKDDCFYIKKDSTHFFYGIVSAVNNSTGALTYAIPASDGGTFFSPDDGQLIVNYGNPMNGGVYLDWANDRVDLYQNHTELERDYNIYNPIFNINAWNSTTAGIAEEDGVVDVSGNNNHGQAFGGVTVVKDKVMGRCFSFDGVNDYLSFPSMVNMLQNLDGCTFTFKIKINALPSTNANVFSGIVGVTNILSGRVGSDGSIYVTSSSSISGEFKDIAANQLLTINDVFSVCFVFDYSNSLAKVYINGSLSNQAEWFSSSPTEVLDCFGIGAKVQTNSSAFWLNGEISDFRFFDKALTSEQIKVIYNQSLVTQYLNSNIYNPILNLDANYSTTASIAVADGVIDVSGNHNNGQATGSNVTVVQDAEMGDCFHFNNETTSVIAIDSIGDTSNDKGYTVSLKIKHGKNDSNCWFISRRTKSGNSVLDWQLIYYDNEFKWNIFSTSNSGITPLNNPIYPAPVIGEKHTYSISVDKDNKTAQCYYDGQPYGDLLELSDYPNTANTQVVIGGPWSQGGSDFACLCDISDVRIYPRALTATEVYNVYQQSLDLEAFENPEKLLSYDEINVHNFDNNSLVQDNMFRLGNLNGVPGISDNRSGVFIGGENEYIRYDKLNGLQIKGTAEKAETAQLAKQLGTTTIGSSTTPIYLVNGNPTECGGSLYVDITGNAATATTAAACSGNAATATSATKTTISAATAATWYSLTGTTYNATSGTAYGLVRCGYANSRPDAGLYYDANATSGDQRVILNLGNATANTTNAGKNGYIQLWGTGTTSTSIVPANPSSNNTVTLPTATGTLALTSSDITGNAATATKALLTPTHDNTLYPVVFGSSHVSTADNQSLRIGSLSTTSNHCPVRARAYCAAANTEGAGTLSLGNGIAKTSDNNATGGLLMYGNGTTYVYFLMGTTNSTNRTLTINSNFTTNRTYTLPNGDGTLALTSSNITGNADTATTATNANNAKLTHTVGDTYYPIVLASSAKIDDSAQSLRIGCATTTLLNCALRGKTYYGAANTQGESALVIGNNIAKTSANNSRGGLTLYGTGEYYLHFRSGDVTASRTATLLGGSSDVTLTLPSSNGTLALTSSNITGSSASCTGNAASSTYSTYNRVVQTSADTVYDVIIAAHDTSNTTSTDRSLRTAVESTTATHSAFRFKPGANTDTSGTTVNSDLYIGNNLANNNSTNYAKNRRGRILMYGTNTGYTVITPSYNSTSSITLTLPNKTGTLALTSDIPSDDANATLYMSVIKKTYSSSSAYGYPYVFYNIFEYVYSSGLKTVYVVPAYENLTGKTATSVANGTKLTITFPVAFTKNFTFWGNQRGGSHVNAMFGDYYLGNNTQGGPTTNTGTCITANTAGQVNSTTYVTSLTSFSFYDSTSVCTGLLCYGY